MALRANVAKHMRDTLLGDGLPEQTESGADLLSANDGDPLKEAAPLTVCEICGEREAAGFWGEKEACQTCIDRELAAEAVAVEAEPSPVRVPFPDTKPASAAAFQMECFNRLGLQPTEISRRLGEGWSKGKKAADLPGLWDTLQAVGTEQLPLGAGE
jgi:hypothetical protein